jgi:maltose-binding protein MalE
MARITAKNPNLNFKVTSIPQIRNSKNRSTYGKIYGVAVLRSSQNRAAASIIQKALTQGEAQQVTLADSGGLQYPYRTTPAGVIKNDFTVLFARQAIQTVGFYTPSFDFIYSLFNSTLNQIASGALDVDKGSRRIENEINNYIGKNQL